MADELGASVLCGEGLASSSPSRVPEAPGQPPRLSRLPHWMSPLRGPLFSGQVINNYLEASEPVSSEARA